MAFPHTDLRVPTITEKDEVDLAFGRELGVDWIAASFVRSGEDLRRVRELAGDVPVIAKIELAAAYANLDDILSEAAGVMVARGDLGVQLPLETIPLVQANILRRTNEAGVVSITATEMLESMTHSPRPTRAEVTDVANAVLAGTDAVMLSAETAVGLYPGGVGVDHGADLRLGRVGDVDDHRQAHLPHPRQRGGFGGGPGGRRRRRQSRHRDDRCLHRVGIDGPSALQVPPGGPDRRVHTGRHRPAG